MKYLRNVFLALMVICLIYSVTIFRVGSGTFSYVIWLFGGAVFGAAFFFAGKGRWNKVPAVLRKICYCLAALAAVAFLLCMTAMLSHFSDKGEKDLDYIIVLGAQMRGNGPSVIFKYRLDAAYEYLMENPGTVCIVSGGKGMNESVSEGEGGKEYLVSKGVPAERIIAETRAMDTVENIGYSMDIIKGEEAADEVRIGVVTNNFHLFRGMYLARRLTGNEISGIAAYTVPWYLPNNMVRECFGIVRDIVL